MGNRLHAAAITLTFTLRISLRIHQHGWGLVSNGCWLSRAIPPIPMRVDAGQPHKAELWSLRSDTLIPHGAKPFSDQR